MLTMIRKDCIMFVQEILIGEHMQNMKRTGFPHSLVREYGIATHRAVGNFTILHSHEWFELGYVEQGQILHSVDDFTCLMQPGDFFIINYNQPHTYHSVGENEIRLLNIMFHPSFFDATLSGSHSFSDLYSNYLFSIDHSLISGDPTKMRFSDKDNKIYTILRDIEREYTEKKSGWRQSIRGLLIYVIMLTLRGDCMPEESEHPIGFSQQMIDYVQMNYMKPIHIEDTYKSGCYSAAYLSKKFSLDTGFTFSYYLKHVRINASCRLLANTNMTINSISQAVGYTDTTFFHNTFREIIGMSPNEYRIMVHERKKNQISFPEGWD